MPTPVAHTLAGYAFARLSPKRAGRLPLFMLVLILFAANAPDMDFIPGLLVGRPSDFHSGITHSLGFALLISAFMAGALSFKTGRFLPNFLLFLGAYLTHMLLDYLNPDGRPPYGIPALWPFSSQYFISSTPVFLGVHHSDLGAGTTIGFIRSVLNMDNLRAMIYEALVMAPFVAAGLWLDHIRQAKAQSIEAVEKG